MSPTFFASGSELREWLEAHHAGERELWIGFHKKDSGKGGITYPEALDEALCFGWIDGVRKSIDAASYTIRFTPRKPRSNWSEVNIRRAHELAALGRMRPPGTRAFEERDEEKTKQYSYEARSRDLDPALAERFRANAGAWAFFQSQPPYYRRVAQWYVMSAKKEETRLKRLAELMDRSAQGLRLPQIGAEKKTPKKPAE
jgi:uncharacterized protein YdeI (YjbR/CyaY-like superfamily)